MSLGSLKSVLESVTHDRNPYDSRCHAKMVHPSTLLNARYSLSYSRQFLGHLRRSAQTKFLLAQRSVSSRMMRVTCRLCNLFALSSNKASSSRGVQQTILHALTKAVEACRTRHCGRVGVGTEEGRLMTTGQKHLRFLRALMAQLDHNEQDG